MTIGMLYFLYMAFPTIDSINMDYLGRDVSKDETWSALFSIGSLKVGEFLGDTAYGFSSWGCTPNPLHARETQPMDSHPLHARESITLVTQ